MAHDMRSTTTKQFMHAALGLLVAATLTGCVLVIDNEDNGDGYWAAEHDVDIDGIKADRKAQARQIMTAVRSEFDADALVRDEDIRIAVRDGVVTLSGETFSAATLDRALKIAADTDGVDSVVSRVVVIVRRP